MTGIGIAIRYAPVQNYLVQKTAAFLSKKIGAPVKIDYFSWNLFQDVAVNGFLIGDRNNDTIISAKSLNIDISYWSLFQKKFSIDAIALDGAVVHLETDTSGRLNLATLFSGDTTVSQPTVNTSKKPFDWLIDLKKICLTTVDFLFDDKKNKAAYAVNLPKLLVDIDKLGLNDKKTVIESILIDKPYIAIQNTSKPPTEKEQIPIHFLDSLSSVHIKNITIADAVIKVDNINKAIKEKGIDFNHLALTKVNISLQNGWIKADTITADATALTLNEKSGFAINNLQAAIRFTPQLIALNQLSLSTPNSKLTNSFSLSFNHLDDFKNFNEKVKLKAQLENTQLALKDLAFFVPKIEKFQHNDFVINGAVEGKVNTLRGKNLVINFGNHTFLKGSFSADGLPDFANTFISFNLDRFQTTATDMHHFYPYKKLPKEIEKLGLIAYSGHFDGFPTDFVTNGKLYTSLGNATTDINLKIDKNTNTSNYSGLLNLNHFNLGKLIDKENEITYIAGNLKVNGSGFKAADINTKVNGKITELIFRNHNYSDITIDGRLAKKSFDGTLRVLDEFLAGTFDGNVDFSNTIPKFLFNADLEKADLKAMNLTKDALTISGKLQANFSGKKIDDLIGEINASKFNIQRGDYQMNIADIHFSSTQLSPTVKKLSLNSPYLEAEVYGQYNFTELPRAIKNYLYTTFTKNPELNVKPIRPQQFDFFVRIYDSSGITKLIDPKFKLIRNSVIEGNFNSINHEIAMNGFIPELVYDNYRITKNEIKLNSANGDFDFAMTTDQLYIKDSLFLDTLVLATEKLDSNGFKLTAQVFDSKKYNRAILQALVSPKSNSTDISFLPTSDVYLGGNKWQFSPDNKINIYKKIISAENMVFFSGAQELSLKTFLTNDTMTGVNLIAKETNLSELLALFNTKAKDLKGRVNGNVLVSQLFYGPKILANVDINALQLGNIPLGDLRVRSKLTDSLDKANLYLTLKNDINDIDIYGTYTLTKGKSGMDLTANIIKGDLRFLNYPSFEKYVKQVNGDFSANLTIKGPLNDIALDGKVVINNADLTVSFLNTHYSLKNEEVKVSKNTFDIDQITLYDVYNNTATGSGKMYHKNFKNFTLDLKVVTPNFQCLNTTQQQMPTFFGEVLGSGTILFSGETPLVNVRAFAKTNIGTHCAIPITTTYETNTYSFYKFVNKAADTLPVLVKKKSTPIKLKGVNFILDLDVTPDAILDVILDESAGDKLSSQGSGNIKIEVLRNGRFNIYGLYEVVKGDYLFTLQNIVNKRFNIQRGGTITFNGDVYKAQLNMDATYTTRTSTYDLVADLNNASTNTISEEALSRAKNRVATNLLLKLRGILSNPEIQFDISPQDVDPLVKTYVDNIIQQLRTNDAEMNKQVFGLLVLNRFLPITSSAFNTLGNNSGTGGSAAINTVSEFLSSQLSRYMSDMFENLNVKDFDIRFNLKQYDQTTNNSSSTTFDQRRELQLALSKRFLNNRLSINVGGNLDFGDRTDGNNTTKQTTNITGDFQIEYVLDKNGNWRIKAFNRGDYDNFYQKNINKTGIGISYRKEFDGISDFFRKKKDNKRKPPKPEVSFYGKEDEKVLTDNVSTKILED